MFISQLKEEGLLHFYSKGAFTHNSSLVLNKKARAHIHKKNAHRDIQAWKKQNTNKLKQQVPVVPFENTAQETQVVRWNCSD